MNENGNISETANDSELTSAIQPENTGVMQDGLEQIGEQMASADLGLLITIFVLALFLGREIITKVPPTLHTPLMSGSNAISGITLVGALAVASNPSAGGLAHFVAFLAVICATVNVVGGFLVTNRMLSMFRQKG